MHCFVRGNIRRKWCWVGAAGTFSVGTAWLVLGSEPRLVAVGRLLGEQCTPAGLGLGLGCNFGARGRW